MSSSMSLTAPTVVVPSVELAQEAFEPHPEPQHIDPTADCTLVVKGNRAHVEKEVKPTSTLVEVDGWLDARQVQVLAGTHTNPTVLCGLRREPAPTLPRNCEDSIYASYIVKKTPVTAFKNSEPEKARTFVILTVRETLHGEQLSCRDVEDGRLYTVNAQDYSFKLPKAPYVGPFTILILKNINPETPLVISSQIGLDPSVLYKLQICGAAQMGVLSGKMQQYWQLTNRDGVGFSNARVEVLINYDSQQNSEFDEAGAPSRDRIYMAVAQADIQGLDALEEKSQSLESASFHRMSRSVKKHMTPTVVTTEPLVQSSAGVLSQVRAKDLCLDSNVGATVQWLEERDFEVKITHRIALDLSFNDQARAPLRGTFVYVNNSGEDLPAGMFGIFDGKRLVASTTAGKYIPKGDRVTHPALYQRNHITGSVTWTRPTKDSDVAEAAIELKNTAKTEETVTLAIPKQKYTADKLWFTVVDPSRETGKLAAILTRANNLVNDRPEEARPKLNGDAFEWTVTLPPEQTIHVAFKGTLHTARSWHSYY